MRKTRKKNSKASALITSVMILGISLTVALSITVVSIRERKASIESNKSNMAYQTADQGIEAVMYDLLKSGKSTTDDLSGCNASSGLIEIGNYAVELLDKDSNAIDCTSSASLALVKKLKSTGVSASSVQRAERAVEVPVNNSCIDESVKSTDEFTKLLLHFDGGPDGESFVDSSENDYSISESGNVSISSDQSKFCKSAYFDGNGDYLSLADSADWDFGSGSFTVDFWFRAPDVTTQQMLFGQINSGSAYAPVRIDLQSARIIVYMSSSGASWDIVSAANTGAASVSMDTWYHVAVVRNDNVLKIYLNGTEKASADISGTLFDSAETLKMGGSGADYYFNGYLEEMRTSKGVARWTDAFASPTFPY